MKPMTCQRIAYRTEHGAELYSLRCEVTVSTSQSGMNIWQWLRRKGNSTLEPFLMEPGQLRHPAPQITSTVPHM